MYLGGLLIESFGTNFAFSRSAIRSSRICAVDIWSFFRFLFLYQGLCSCPDSSWSLASLFHGIKSCLSIFRKIYFHDMAHPVHHVDSTHRSRIDCNFILRVNLLDFLASNPGQRLI